jgi:hypothetical protein
MEIPKRLWIAVVVLGAGARLLLGDAFYMVAIFGGYAAISHSYQLRRQAA